MPPGDVEREAGQRDQQVGGHDEERRDQRAVADLRGAQERRLRRGESLHDRRDRASQVDRRQDQVEAVDAQHVEALVPARAQVAGHGQEVRQRDSAEQRADQRGAEREGEQEHQAHRAPGDRRHVVPPQEQLTEPGALAQRPPGAGLAAQLGHDQQPAVGPAAPLDAQRAEVGRGGAVAHPFRAVVQPPAVHAQVDGGLGVLDDGAVLDEVADLPVPDVGGLHDVVEGPLADHRVRADPEGGVVVGEALVDDVLQVRRRAGDPLQPGGRAREGAVGSLGDGHVAVLALLEQVHEPQAVFGQQDAVGVERHDVVGVRDVHVPARRRAGDQRDPGHRLDLAVGTAHQPDVAIEVHGLVGLVGQRHVALAFEARQVGAERPDQPAVKAAERLLIQHHPLLGGGQQRRRDRPERSGQSQDDLVGDEGVRVVDDLLAGGQSFQPGGRLVVVAGQDHHRADPERLLPLARDLEPVQRPGEPGRGPGQQFRDLARQGPRGLELLTGLLGLRHVRVVDQQDHPLVRVLLQRGREQGVADNAGVFPVGRDDRGQRRRRRVEEVVQDGAAGPVMSPRPVQEPEPAQQVGQGRDGQQGDDHQVQDRLRPADRGLVAGMEEVLEEPRDHVAEPHRHRDDDGQPRQGHATFAGRLGDHGQRQPAPVSPPLLAPAGPAGPRGAFRRAGRRAGIRPGSIECAIRILVGVRQDGVERTRESRGHAIPPGRPE